MHQPLRPWLAALLGLVFSPLGLLYVGRPAWAGLYLLLSLGLGFFALWQAQSFLASLAQLLLMGVAGFHAYRLATRAPTPRSHYSRWYGLLSILALGLLLILLLRAFVIEPFRMPFASMQPSLPPGANLIVKKWGYGHYASFGLTLARRPLSSTLERGQLITFVHPQSGNAFVQRLVGLPGDRLLFQGDLLELNEQPIRRRDAGWHSDAQSGDSLPVSSEALGSMAHPVIALGTRFFPPPDLQAPGFLGACTQSAAGTHCVVPRGHYFTLGDERGNSADGRIWGFVPSGNIIGPVLWVWPPAGG